MPKEDLTAIAARVKEKFGSEAAKQALTSAFSKNMKDSDERVAQTNNSVNEQTSFTIPSLLLAKPNKPGTQRGCLFDIDMCSSVFDLWWCPVVYP